MTRLITLILATVVYSGSYAQGFTLADTLRGTLSPIRAAFDVHYYELDITINIKERSISGSNAIHFMALADIDSLQIDLFDNLVIDSIMHQGARLTYSRLHNAVFVSFPKRIAKGSKAAFTVHYHGQPVAAKSAPWDGGFVWKQDAKGQPHIGVACEGLGASSWWPNKDHLSDEPDSMRMHFTAPSGLMCVGNGRSEGSESANGQTRWSWKVSNPINNYNVTLNIADYVHFNDWHVTDGDSLQLNYYVLLDNYEKAVQHFKQVRPMLEIFERAFGPYPFREDGFALVETTYAGMEHQSAIAYGNQYMKGYLGRYPADMDFDYIIVHETGHEWWGNSLTINDIADMWVHESFCTYAESVFVEGKYGYDKMMEYQRYQKNFITNQSPIIGVYGVNQEGNSRDIYYKGSWMLHTLRSVLNDDDAWRALLLNVATHFRHRNVDGAEVIAYMMEQTGLELAPFFEQYLEHANLPVLEYRQKGSKLTMRWKADAEGFSMPMEINIGGEVTLRVAVSSDGWTTVTLPGSVVQTATFREDRFLFSTKLVSGKKSDSKN